MTRKAIERTIKGIECDNPSCDWQDLEAEFEPELWLNKPCPECGANLFTNESYEQMKFISKVIDAINEVVAETGIDCTMEERVFVELNRNEKGLVNGFKILDEGKDND